MQGMVVLPVQALSLQLSHSFAPGSERYTHAVASHTAPASGIPGNPMKPQHLSLSGQPRDSGCLQASLGCAGDIGTCFPQMREEGDGPGKQHCCWMIHETRGWRRWGQRGLGQLGQGQPQGRRCAGAEAAAAAAEAPAAQGVGAATGLAPGTQSCRADQHASAAVGCAAGVAGLRSPSRHISHKYPLIAHNSHAESSTRQPRA